MQHSTLICLLMPALKPPSDTWQPKETNVAMSESAEMRSCACWVCCVKLVSYTWTWQLQSANFGVIWCFLYQEELASGTRNEHFVDFVSSHLSKNVCLAIILSKLIGQSICLALVLVTHTALQLTNASCDIICILRHVLWHAAVLDSLHCASRYIYCTVHFWHNVMLRRLLTQM